MLELFADTARLSKAFSRCGLEAEAWDIEYGEACDLVKECNVQHIISLLRTGVIVFLWLGIPCNTWSRARRFDRHGPPPLRDDHDFLWGWPDLNPKDQSKVDVSNKLVYNSMRIIREAMRLQIPWVIENPKTSRLWLVHQVQRLLRAGAEFCEVHFCQFGEPWRKATYLLFWGLPSFMNLSKICQGVPRGFCSRTGKRHIQLSGVDDKGRWLTRLAQPYPWRLCHCIAARVSSQLLSKQYNI